LRDRPQLNLNNPRSPKTNPSKSDRLNQKQSKSDLVDQLIILITCIFAELFNHPH
jgi:hypothetical protein